MTAYRIGTHNVSGEFSGFQLLLADAHVSKTRPLCLCRPSGIAMYIAQVQGRYIVKRMPYSGLLHAPACDSFEPPPELSGAGQVMGSAIQENPDTGQSILKYGFSLSKMPGRKAPEPSGGSASSGAKTDGTKLSLLGLLYHLWEQAGLHKWFPAMAGKRNWGVVRKYLLLSAQTNFSHGQSTLEHLYVPEPFTLEHKDDIARRRNEQLAHLAVPDAASGKRQLKLIIGEVKDITPARYGHKLIIKHLPDLPLMLNADLFNRLHKKFDLELALADSIEKSHLLMIGTFGIETGGVAKVEEMALMLVTENWIPFEHTHDKLLIDQLTTDARSFVKSLRYNLPRQVPLASLVLADTQPTAMAVFIIPPDADEAARQEYTTLIESSQLPTWVWDATQASMPVLPEKQGAKR